MKNGFLTLARIAGVLYLTIAICGGFAELVRTGVVEEGDAAATVQNIVDSEMLFRVAFSSDVVTFCAEVALAIVFYVLFRPVHEGLALLAAFFRLAQAVAVGINLLNQFIPLLIINGGSYLDAFEQEQLDALVLLFMEAQSYGYLIGLVFFGLSTLVLGYLVLRSGYFPQVFGLLLMVIVPIGYIVDSFSSFLIEDKSDVLSVVLVAPAAIVELAFVAWLLVKGAGAADVDAAPNRELVS